MNRATLNNILFVLVGVAGIGGMAAMLSHVGQRVDDQRTSGHLADKLSEMHQRQRLRHISLEARVDRLGLPGCLSPASLTSTANVASCLTAVDGLRALLAERDRDTNAGDAQERALLAGLPPGPVHDEAVRSMGATIDRMHQARDRMSAMDSANADAIQAVLQWAQKNHAALHANGQSLFVDGRRQLDELNRLRAALGAAGQAAEAANQREGVVVAESNRAQLALVRQFNAMY